jgi:hypothetical protein
MAITGHLFQVVGAFGSMLTPDKEEVVEEREDLY